MAFNKFQPSHEKSGYICLSPLSDFLYILIDCCSFLYFWYYLLKSFLLSIDMFCYYCEFNHVFVMSSMVIFNVLECFCFSNFFVSLVVFMNSLIIVDINFLSILHEYNNILITYIFFLFQDLYLPELLKQHSKFCSLF